MEQSDQEAALVQARIQWRARLAVAYSEMSPELKTQVQQWDHGHDSPWPGWVSLIEPMPTADLTNRLHVLFADDEPDTRDIFALALRLRGHRVTLLTDGAEALQAITVVTPPFNMIVLDVHMPVVDGLTATRRIRELSQGNTVPIVLLTAYSETDADALAAGANLLLRKPILPVELLNQLESLERLKSLV